MQSVSFTHAAVSVPRTDLNGARILGIVQQPDSAVELAVQVPDAAAPQPAEHLSAV